MTRVALGFALAIGLTWTSVGLGAETPAQLIIGAEDERRGDVESLLAKWWKHITAEPDSAVSQALLTLWPERLALSPGVGPSAREWEELERQVAANGWARELVLARRIAALREEGQLETARALDHPAGTPRRWLGIGPFGHDGPAALHAIYDPELRFDVSAPAIGTEDWPVSWRGVFVAANDATLTPNECFGRSGAAYYFRSCITVATPTRALIELSTSGALRLWLDGVELALLDRYRSHLPQRVWVGVELDAGTHSLLVKCGSQPFALKLRDPAGLPLEFADADPQTPPDSVTTSRLSSAIRPQGFGLEDWNVAAARVGALPMDLQLPLALLRARESDAVGCHELLLAAEADPQCDATTLALAVEECAEAIEYLPADWRKTWLTEHRRRGLAKDPRCVPLVLAEANLLASDGHSQEAVELIDGVLAEAPRALSALLQREEIADAQNWHEERRQVLEAMKSLCPKNTLVEHRWLRYWRGQKRVDLVQQLRSEMYARSGSLGTAIELATGHLQLGARELAIRIVDELPALDGDSSMALQEQVELYQRLGMDERALAVIAALRTRVPDDADLFLQAAALHEKAGADEAAIEAYRRALELRPGRIQVVQQIEYLERKLKGQSAPPAFWEPYRISLSTVLSERPAPDHYPRAASVLLLDQMVTRILPTGGGEEMVHQIIWLTSQQSVEQYSVLSVPGEVIELRVLTPEGEELHPTAGGDRGGYTLPGLRENCVIEHRSVRRFDLARERDLQLGPFYFRDPDFANAFHTTEWIVLLPAEWQPTIEERALTQPREERLINGLRELKWRYTQMAHVEPEFQAPPADRVLPNVRVTRPLKWERVLERYAAAAVAENATTPVLKTAAHELLVGIADRRAQVEALYEAVCGRVKTNDGGENATAIWLEKSGDRNLLLSGLLRAAGIPVESVFVAERDELNPYVDWSQPGSASFPFQLLCVDMENAPPLYFNANFRMAPLGQIPRQFQGGRAIRSDHQHGCRWVTLPIDDADQESRSLSTVVELDANSTTALALSGTVAFNALVGSQMKEQLASVTDQQRTLTLENFLRSTFRGAEIKDASFSALDDRSTPFAMHFAIATQQPGILRVAEGAPALQTVFLPANLRRGFLRQGQRVFPYHSRNETVYREDHRVRLGGYRVASLPANLQLQGPWGSYSLRFELAGDEVRVARRLHVKPFFLEPAQYESLVAFCTQVDRKEEERIVFVAQKSS
ncbi:MAG: hypothetical protein ACKVX7_17555 [Planctomycetota bacterium]